MTTQVCTKCRQNKHIEEFPYRRRGDKKETERTTHCSSCREKDVNRQRRLKEANKENDGSLAPLPRAEKLPVMTIEDFLTSLRHHNGNIDAEVRVDITALPSHLLGLEGIARAHAISKEVWECTRYRFRCVTVDCYNRALIHVIP